MPVAAAYLKGFGLKIGLRLAGCVLTDINIKHETIRKYNRYQYPTRLTFTGNNIIPEKLLTELHQLVYPNRTIYTQYGNPYICNFGEFQYRLSRKAIIIQSVGSCVRSS